MPTEAAAEDPLFGHLEKPTGVYQWHDDVFEPPPEPGPGEKRTESESGFPGRRRGRLGHQFHPEATPELWELWIARHPVEVAEAGVDVEALRHEVHEGAEASLGFRTRFFDAFIGRVRTGGTRSGTGMRDRDRAAGHACSPRRETASPSAM